MSQGQPDMLCYIVPDTVTSVEINTTISLMTIRGDNYRIVTNVQLISGESYYWGIYAFNEDYNDADIGRSFSGEPESGLWSFTAT